jgi:hypothetical protein
MRADSKIHAAENPEQGTWDTEIHPPLGYRKMCQIVYITDSQDPSTNPFSSRNPWSTGDPPAYKSPIPAHRVPTPKPPPPPPLVQDAYRNLGYANLARCSWNGTPLPPLTSPPPPLVQDSYPILDIPEYRPVPAFSTQIMTPVTPPPQAQPTPPLMPCLFPPGPPPAERTFPQPSEPIHIPNCLPTGQQMVSPQLPSEQVQPPSADSRVCEVKREVVTWTFGA